MEVDVNAEALSPSSGEVIPPEAYWGFEAYASENDWFKLNWLEAYQPSWLTVLVVVAVAVYSAWYYLLVVNKPRLVGGGSALKQHIVSHCPILSQYYYPTFWAPNCHFTTIGREQLQRCPGVTYEREVMLMDDGGRLALDWTANLPAQCDKDDAPVLLFLSGITGSSSDNYVKYCILDGMRHGYRPVVMNYRGCGGLNLTTLQTYSATYIEDLVAVTKRIHKLYPKAAIVGVGVSLGGMILTQYCHQLGTRCDLKAAISISAVLDSVMSRKSLEEPLLNRIYTRFLAKELCNLIRRNSKHLEEKLSENVDVPHLLRSRSISEFDERLTAPLFGYSTLDDYYRDATNSDKLHKISIPYICITSTDDPFVPEKSIPYAAFERNPNTVLITTTSGGHIGFIEGIWPTKETWMNRVNGQLLAALKHYEHS